VGQPHESGETPDHTKLTKMKARIEIVADFVDVKRIRSLLKNYPIAEELCSPLWLRESEHQPRLIGDPMRVQLRHLVEQLLVGRRGFLQPIEILAKVKGLCYNVGMLLHWKGW
jgi:hypothetical protein